MRSSNNTYASSTGYLPRPISFLRWFAPFLCFLVLGLTGAIVFTSILNHHSPIVAFAVVLLFPPLLLFGAFAIPPALANLRELHSHLTVWHWLWMLLFVSGLVLRVRDVQDIQSSPTDAAAGFRIVLVSLVGFYLLIVLGLRRNDWFMSLFRGLPAALAIYALVSAVSTIWSVYPPWTIYKSVEYLVDVSLLAALLAVIDTARDYDLLLNWTWTLYGALLGSVWLSAIIRPQDGFLRGEALQRDIGLLPIQLAGVFPAVGSNKVGDMGAILAVLALCRLLTHKDDRRSTSQRVWYIALFLFSFVSLILSQTRSALAGFLLGLIVLLVLTRRWKTVAALCLSGSSLLLLERVREKLLSFLERGESSSQLASLSSRIDWWAYAWHKFMQHPWTGLGAYAAGRFAVMSNVSDPGTSSVHSDYIEILVGTSIWGLLPMVIALLGTWWIVVRCLRNSQVSYETHRMAIEVTALLTVVTIRSFLNDILTFHAAFMFLVLVGYAEFLRRQNRLQQKEPFKF